MNSGSIHAEPSTVVYLSVLDIHADTIEAMSEVAQKVSAARFTLVLFPF